MFSTNTKTKFGSVVLDGVWDLRALRDTPNGVLVLSSGSNARGGVEGPIRLKSQLKKLISV